MNSTVLKLFRSIVKQKRTTYKDVVFITGCDSGLGLSFALVCHSLNMTVISACQSIQSPGARHLQNISEPERVILMPLDLLKEESIKNAQRSITKLMQTNSEYQFTALVNNAGVMCFGEFEWQTKNLIKMQINVNLLGTMLMTKEMLPLLRQHKGRIINITSHCGLQALPTLGPYAATKAALRFWNDALRIEMKQYGVNVINFVPGSLIMNTNIAKRQSEYAKEMFNHFSTEQQKFYGSYFWRLNKYLSVFADIKSPAINDDALFLKFQDALTNPHPRTIYIHEPWRYKFYHMLFRFCPTYIADWLTVKFCAMPRPARENHQEKQRTIQN